jgi:hypothetical protein
MSSAIKALAMGALGAGAGGMTGLAVGSTRQGLAERRMRKLLEEAKTSRTRLEEDGL